jgi:general stress protein YciG
MQIIKESKMAGTTAGGRKAAQTNRKKYGHDFYAEIGRKGGRNGHTGGFAANPELAKIAGAIGGRKSKRGPARKKD